MTLIQSGFSDGPGDWKTAAYAKDEMSDPPAVSLFDNGEVGFDITLDTTDDWRIQLIHDVSITKDQDYTLCYDARATAPRKIIVNIDADMDDNYDPLMVFADGPDQDPRDGNREVNGRVIDLTTDYQSFVHYFNGAATDATGRLTFNLGLETANVYFDNIGFYEGTGDCPDIGSIKEPVGPELVFKPARFLDESEDDYVHVRGNKLYDAYGNPVRMTGANWFGFESASKELWGLNRGTHDEHVQAMAEKGINVIRIPVTSRLLLDWKADGQASNSFRALVTAAKKYGVKLIIDTHGPVPDNNIFKYPVWYHATVTTNQFIQAWEWLAEEYKNDDTIIAFDLVNEPNGWDPAKAATEGEWGSTYACWGLPTGNDPDCKNLNNWPYTARIASERILQINPNLLMIVEGVEAAVPPGGTDLEWYWRGGNLAPVGDKRFRINLGDDYHKLIYSPHVYGPAVLENQPWWKTPQGDLDFSKDGLYNRKWKRMFGFIEEREISHLFFGEWGGVTRTSDGNGQFASKPQLVENNVKWMTSFSDYLVETDSSHTFWAYNPNSDDTGGLVGDDWKTWDPVKYGLLEKTLWKNNSGKFISLDHRRALPGGVSVSDVYGVDPNNEMGNPSTGTP